jgi:HK97 family phage major capsid protein
MADANTVTVQIPEEIKQSILDLRKVAEGAATKEMVEKALGDFRKELEGWRPNGRSGSEPPPEEGKGKGKFDKARAKTLLEKMIIEPATTAELKRLQELNDACYIVGKTIAHNRSVADGEVIPYASVVKGLGLYQDFARQAGSSLSKAMDTATSDEGAEFIPTGFSASLIDQIRLELRVPALFGQFTMPTSPYTFPVAGTDLTAFKVPEATSDSFLTEANKITAMTPGSSNVSFTAVGLGALVVFSEEVDEDSIVPVVPYIRERIAIAMARARETAIVNGDTTSGESNINGTTVGNSTTDARKCWYGLRYYSPAAQQVSLATFNLQTIRTVRSNMGKYGVAVSDLAWIASLKTSFKLLNLQDDGGNYVVVTLDKYGPNATILTGEVGKLDGIPVIVSELLPDNLNACGLYDGVTTTKSVLVCVNRRCFLQGERRGLRIQSAPIIWTDQGLMVAKARLAFKRTLTPGSDEACANLGYAVDVS